MAIKYFFVPLNNQVNYHTTMSEIICSYTKDEETEQFYFLMERNVNFQQFNDFLKNSRIIDESHSIYYNNELIDSDIKFVNSVNSAIQNNTAMAFKFNKSSVPDLPSEVEKNNDLTFGETIKAIMQKIDMNFEKSPARPKELIQSIPFPHIVVIRQYIKHVRQNPSELTSVIQQAAKFYSVEKRIYTKKCKKSSIILKTRETTKVMAVAVNGTLRSKTITKEKTSVGETYKKFLIAQKWMPQTIYLLRK